MKIDVEDLNENQRRIYDSAMEIMPQKRPNNWEKQSAKLRHEVIKGVAGSGKTTLTSLIVRDLLARGLRVFCTAPTHKAAQELERQYGVATMVVEDSAPVFGGMMSTLDGPEFSGTIHSALGLKLVNKDDTQILKADDYRKTTTSVGDKPGYSLCDVLFLEEVSMVGKALKKHLLTRQSIDKFHIISIGDPYQLDPVGDEEPDENGIMRTVPSTIFDEGTVNWNLIEVTRQAADSPIIQLSALCRGNIDHIRDSAKFNKPEGRVMDFVDGKNIIKFSNDNLSDQYLKIIENEPTNSLMNRILTFTNERVDWYNYLIRNTIHEQRIDSGKLAVGTPLKDYAPTEIVILQDSILCSNFSNSQEVLIESVIEGTTIVQAPIEFMDSTDMVTKYETMDFPCYKITICNVESDERTDIEVIYPNSKGAFEDWMWARGTLFRQLKATNRKGSRAGWSWFWETMNKYPGIKHSFASTIHKSQGSTFDNIILDMGGIKKCMTNNPLLAWKLLYVGCTRPRNILYLGMG